MPGRLDEGVLREVCCVRVAFVDDDATDRMHGNGMDDAALEKK